MQTIPMSEHLSLTNNASLEVEHELSHPLEQNNNTSSNRSPLLGRLLKHLAEMNDPQAAYKHSEQRESQYVILGDSWSNSDDDDDKNILEATDMREDSVEKTFYCTDHGEVASDGQNSEIDEQGVWKQREVGWNDKSYNNPLDTDGENTPQRRWFQLGNNRGPRENVQRNVWGFRRRQDEDVVEIKGPREEIVLYYAPDYDSESVDEFHPSKYDDDDDSLVESSSVGHAMPVPPNMPQDSSQPPLRLRWGAQLRNGTYNNRNWNGNRLVNPILRPFLVGSNRDRFTDAAERQPQTNAENAEDDTNDVTDEPSKQDREAVVQSISEGIAGICNDSLMLDPSDGNTASKAQQDENQPPRFFRPIVRLLQLQQQNRRNEAPIKELHAYLRKEDWSLATTLLDSNPSLASTWHRVQRLYGGRYDGEVLPLHAACALRPPASFVQKLASLYPDALLAQERSFGRVPLHVACRSLAHSSVIAILCEMEPRCVEERDSLKRVPIHYLIKNYTCLGEDTLEDGVESEWEKELVEKGSRWGDDGSANAESSEESKTDEDGIIALNTILRTNSECTKAADHRGWIPLHVACSSSSRKGMTRILRILLNSWPESVLCKTSKGSDVFDCLDMAGNVHHTKDLVREILEEAKGRVMAAGHLDDISTEHDLLDFQNSGHDGASESGVHETSEAVLSGFGGVGADESVDSSNRSSPMKDALATSDLNLTLPETSGTPDADPSSSNAAVSDEVLSFGAEVPENLLLNAGDSQCKHNRCDDLSSPDEPVVLNKDTRAEVVEDYGI